jgi:hypothetical protein
MPEKQINIKWVEDRALYFKQKFNEEAKNFSWLMEHGGGMDNIHMLDTIRRLHMLYLECAAHEEVAKTASGKW